MADVETVRLKKMCLHNRSFTLMRILDNGRHRDNSNEKDVFTQQIFHLDAIFYVDRGRH